jgi:uncharacterized protein (TIGR03437 family)
VLNRLQINLILLPLAAGIAFAQNAVPPNPAAGQSVLPPALRAVFASRLASQLAAADTVTVSISGGGIVPVYSTNTTIQAGEWISIYGSNLASTTATWNNDFPKNLAGTSVTINGKPGYLWFVSPGQINLQAPDDTASGSVNVVVTNGSDSSAPSTVTMGQFGPSFSLLGDNKHVAGIIVRSDKSGAYGGGSYDILGPTGTSLGYATKAAKAGDTIEVFGVGFGPTNPPLPAGQLPTQTATIPPSSNLTMQIGGVTVTPFFAGINGLAGLFQFNITLPSGLGTGDVSLSAIVGGAQTPTGVVIALQ